MKESTAKYAQKLDHKLRSEIVEQADNEEMLDFCYRNIGCSMIEIVHPKNLEHPFVMVIDEEGLLTDRPMINYVGSYLYGTHEHLQPIVGDVIVMKEEMTVDGVALELLTNVEVHKLVNEFNRVHGVASIVDRAAMVKAGMLK